MQMVNRMSTELQKLIDRMNNVLSWELAGIIQNLNHALMLTGRERLEYREMFDDNSKENRDHAELIGARIAALGGVPTVEPAKIRQATNLTDMLEAVLALELDAMAGWQAAYEASDAAAPGYKFWFEEMIAEEQQHIDELRMLTGKVSFSAKQLKDAAKAG